MCEGVITVNKIQQICTYTMYKAWSANKALMIWKICLRP